jgi:protein-disulfide isomerase
VNRFGSFDKFNELLLSNSGVVFTDEFKTLINSLIDDNSNIAECILNNNNYRYIYANNREFMELGLKGTPTFILNNHVYSGYSNYRYFRKIVEEETDR